MPNPTTRLDLFCAKLSHLERNSIPLRRPAPLGIGYQPPGFRPSPRPSRRYVLAETHPLTGRFAAHAHPPSLSRSNQKREPQPVRGAQCDFPSGLKELAAALGPDGLDLSGASGLPSTSWNLSPGGPPFRPFPVLHPPLYPHQAQLSSAFPFPRISPSPPTLTLHHLAHRPASANPSPADFLH